MSISTLLCLVLYWGVAVSFWLNVSIRQNDLNQHMFIYKYIYSRLSLKCSRKAG